MNNKEILDCAIAVVKRFKLKLDDDIIQMNDFTRDADQHRAFVIDVSNRRILDSGFLTHGSGSGSRLGRNLILSNKPNSRQSSAGLMRYAEKYKSMKFKISYRLDGLEKGVNDNARKRAIVAHTARYASNTYMSKNTTPGRSWGCPALGREKFAKWERLGYIKTGRYMYTISKRDLKR